MRFLDRSVRKLNSKKQFMDKIAPKFLFRGSFANELPLTQKLLIYYTTANQPGKPASLG